MRWSNTCVGLADLHPASRLPAVRGACLTIVVLAACTPTRDGPTPVVTSVEPPLVCTAQTTTSTVTLHGTGFSPVVVNGLSGTPLVILPDATLLSQGADPIATQVSLPPGANDGTELVVTVGELALGAYGVRVVNPNGNEGTLAAGLTVVPPPGLTAFEPTTYPTGHVVTLSLSGDGFRQGMTVTLGATPPVPATSVQVTSPTSATAVLDLTTVTPGTYDVTVGGFGCDATLSGFVVFEPPVLDIAAIDPPFGCTCDTTTVTITGGPFVSTPVVELRPAGMPGVAPILLERLAFVSPTTLTAVVPAALALGDYDVTVRNPISDAGLGSRPAGFRVVAMPIPTIFALEPGRGTTQDDTTVTILGENFRASAFVSLIDATGRTVFTSPAALTPAQSGTMLVETFPTTTLGVGVYLVRVTNDDEDTFSTFGAFINYNPAVKLNAFVPGTSMKVARRFLAGVSATDQRGNHFIYAIGGATGTSTSALATVEVSQLSKFGDIGPWTPIRQHDLVTPRLGACAVAVPVFGASLFRPAKTYLYVIGGWSGTGEPVDTVERAVVLSYDDAPRMTTATTGAGALDDGTWYYKVSAVMGATDADNPQGETLASDELIITVDSASAVTLSWAATPGAAGYRIYRTDTANGRSQEEHLIADGVTGTSYTDAGDAPGTLPPLVDGSTGVWVIDDARLGTARWGHAAALIDDGDGDPYIVVAGGQDTVAGGFLGTSERAPIDAAGLLGSFSTADAGGLATPRSFFAFDVETRRNVSTWAATGGRLWIMGGLTEAGFTDSIEVSAMGAAGVLPPFTVVGARALSSAGSFGYISNDALYVVGGAGSGTFPTFGSVSAFGRTDAFVTGGDIAGSMSSTSGSLLVPRAFGASIRGAGFLFALGGTTDGTTAVATTEKTF
jgi:hypothetical protein